MVTLSNLRTLSEATEPVYAINGTYLTESQVMALVDLPDDEFISEAAVTLKDIKSGDDLKEAKALIQEAKKLKKSDPDAAKKKAKEAITKLKAIRKKAEQIEDDDEAKEILKAVIPLAFSGGSVIAVCVGVAVAPQILIPAIVACYASLVPLSIADIKIAEARLGQNTTKEANRVLNFKKISRNRAFGVVDKYLQVAEGIEHNKTFLDKLKEGVVKSFQTGAVLRTG